MKSYMICRCILGIIGSIVAIIIGAVFIIEGIRFSDIKGFLIGAPAVLAGIVGIIICIALLKKTKIK